MIVSPDGRRLVPDSSVGLREVRVNADGVTSVTVAMPGTGFAPGLLTVMV
jgi:hypothetical protein